MRGRKTKHVFISCRSNCSGNCLAMFFLQNVIKITKKYQLYLFSEFFCIPFLFYISNVFLPFFTHTLYITLYPLMFRGSVKITSLHKLFFCFFSFQSFPHRFFSYNISFSKLIRIIILSLDFYFGWFSKISCKKEFQTVQQLVKQQEFIFFPVVEEKRRLFFIICFWDILSTLFMGILCFSHFILIFYYLLIFINWNRYWVFISKY